jgi:glutamate-ammonia-ligase adenylyltransferase
MTGARPSIETLTRIAPSLLRLAPAGITPEQCLARLPDRYFALFDQPTIAKHLTQLCSLTIDEPYALDTAYGETGSELRVTVISFDEPGVFSLLAGILGAAGFSIRGGDICTFTRESVTPWNKQQRRGRKSRKPAGLPPRRIVDTFIGTVQPGVTREQCISEVCRGLDSAIPLLLPGGDKEKAKRLVNEAVAERLRADESQSDAGLYPVHLQFETEDDITRMRIDGEDTPYFLYSLSVALTLQNVSIESVAINTYGNIVSDEFELVSVSGEPIADPQQLDHIRLSVLLTKQFTYFLSSAPDPYSALVRFESLTSELVQRTARDGFGALLSNPLILRELAQLLGASDFLWEDFIRRQYENILPMLDGEQGSLSTEPNQLEGRLEQLLAAAPRKDRRKALNEFKDRETFLIDLDHILHEGGFFFLSDRLSNLAEVIVRAALRIAWDELTERYGRPRTVAGLEVSFAVFGLGKLGGRALGYASDIELLFVYSDNGSTDGDEGVSNVEFFERLVAETTGCIESKREGIFQIDLRLRPYGSAGPRAASLESFNRYYGRGGEAHSYEKLALTRLRAIAGDTEFGARIEQLRDELIYAAGSIDLEELRTLRARQLTEKAGGHQPNAKFSPGGLVDLEYGLQILLVQHGRTNPTLRTQSLHAGLDELKRSGVMSGDEADRLVRAYRFLRNLINGLRMLRGNAQDLFLPEPDSLEFSHLARRAGYERQGDLSPEAQLRIDFDSGTAAVRAFIEHHLGRKAIPGTHVGNAADLVLATDLDPDTVAEIAARAGLQAPARAVTNIRSMADQGSARERFSELIVLAWPSLKSTSDPDMALNNWDRYVTALPERESHFRRLLRQPQMLDLMLQVFSASQFLSETLIRNPASLEWSLEPSVVKQARTTEEMYADLKDRVPETANVDDRLRAIRLFRQREILRIGTRDICLGTNIRTITQEISSLAAAILRVDLEALFAACGASRFDTDRFCILAFGKLGGNELNYSSDIDLLGVYADGDPERREEDQAFFASVMENLRDDLMRHTADGHVYRVDFRLRPYGNSGFLVYPLSATVRYYRETAAPWEHQALLRLNPVAGNLELGRGFLARLRSSSIAVFSSGVVRESIEHLRSVAVQQLESGSDDIKTGEGGIRDLEFLVQGLQMSHAAEHPVLLTGNTFEAIDRLRGSGILGDEEADEMAGDYEYLRRVEHFLQVYEDRQVHTLPTKAHDLYLLARRLHGADTTTDSFRTRLDAVRKRVRTRYLEFLQDDVVKAD